MYPCILDDRPRTESRLAAQPLTFATCLANSPSHSSPQRRHADGYRALPCIGATNRRQIIRAKNQMYQTAEYLLQLYVDDY